MVEDYVSSEGYSFSIYNRYGMLLFNTDNPDKGWDGTYLGSTVQDGTYIYHLQFVNGEGNLVEKTDAVIIVR